MKGKYLIIGAIVALLLVGLVVMVTKSGKTSNETNQNSASSGSTSSNAATITYSDSGFSPATVTVKSGQSVKIVNSSSQAVQFDSNPHPVHTDETELNVGLIAAGSSQTVTLTKTGTWGYHNHLDPSQRGTIVVQ